MRGISWRSAFLILVGGFLVLVAFLPDPTTQQLSNWSTVELISSLNTDRVSLRRAVVRQLVARSRTVIPALEQGARESDTDHLSGIFEVLEELMLSGDPETAEAAESALERLAAGTEGPVAEAAMQVLFSNATLRHARAISHYLELGGQFARSKTARDPLAPLAHAGPPGPFSPRILLLDDRWSGGDAGLTYVARVFPGETIITHIGEDAGVSEAAIERLKVLRRNVYIRREGEACLGIIVNSVELLNGVLVADVVAKSPAGEAGLRRGDLIVQFGEQQIHYLDELRQFSARHKPGERVEIRLIRNSATYRIKMALGTDFGSQDCRCLDQSPDEAEHTSRSPRLRGRGKAA